MTTPEIPTKDGMNCNFKQLEDIKLGQLIYHSSHSSYVCIQNFLNNKYAKKPYLKLGDTFIAMNTSLIIAEIKTI